MGHSSWRDFKLHVTVCLYLFCWYFYSREISFIVAWRGGVEGVRMLNVLLDLIECRGEGRVEKFCKHAHRFPPPPALPGYSNWKLISSYLYSCREIRRLHKFCMLTFIFIAFYSALFSEKTICWGWVNDAPLSCRGWSDKCILLKSANYLSWTNKYPALSIGTAHDPTLLPPVESF